MNGNPVKSWREISTDLPPLYRICSAMGSTLELRDLLGLILDLTMEQLRAQQGSILLLDRESEQLKMLASRGLPPEVERRGYVPRKGSIAEWVIEHDTPLILDDISKETRFTSIADARGIYSSMCVPLRAKGKVIGTINITRNRPEAFYDKDLETLVILATQAAVSIENARLHAEIIQSERLAAVGRTTAAISHCVKNILTILTGGTSLVAEGARQRKWNLVDDGIGIVQRSTERISLLVLDMLDYSKERKPIPEKVDLSRLIEDVITGEQFDAKRTAVELKTSIDPDCRTLEADPQQLFRCVLNLTHNAIEALAEWDSETRTVEIAVERSSADAPLVPRDLRDRATDFMLIHVRDNGPGIAEEHLHDIFQPFFSSKGSKGTGLGLAVARKIAREHGGELVVETAVGQGTTFTLILPAVVASSEPIPSG